MATLRPLLPSLAPSAPSGGTWGDASPQTPANYGACGQTGSAAHGACEQTGSAGPDNAQTLLYLFPCDAWRPTGPLYWKVRVTS